MKSIILAALLIGAALPAAPPATTSPPLCRVEARFTPTWTGSVLPDAFRTVSLRLEDGCTGEAHIQTGNLGGRHGTDGPIYALTQAEPLLIFTVPSYRIFYWLSQSGTPYLITLHRR